MIILVTGFEPFGGECRNPSREIVEALPDHIGGAELIKLILPVSREKASTRMAEAVEKFLPDAVLSVGQAGGRSSITVERIAVNLEDYNIPDNDGSQPREEPVVPDGPDGYFSTLPVTAMVKAIREAGIPAEQSLSAGTFVCNHVMYTTGHLLTMNHPKARFGFLHVPFLPEQAAAMQGRPSMSLELSARAVEIAIEVIAKTSKCADHS